MPYKAAYYIIVEDDIYYSHKDSGQSNKTTAVISHRFTSGSCCRSSASITGGGLPSPHNSLYIETSSPMPSSMKDGGTTLSKDGWDNGIGYY